MSRPLVLAVFAVAAGCAAAESTLPVRQLVRVTFDEADQADVIRPAFSDDGLRGQALTGTGLWQIPALGHFELSEGTVEFRLRLEPLASQAPGWNMFRIHPPGPEDAYRNGFNVIYGWGGGLFLLVGDSEGRQEPLAFHGTSEWKPEEWHHCAFTWRVGAPGRSSLAFYVDETLVERRAGLTLRFDAAAWASAAAAEGPARLMILVGAVWGQPAPGAIDDLRIYDHVRRYEVAP